MGGISQGILAHLEDEYGSKDSLTFPVTPPHLSPEIPQSKLLMRANIIQVCILFSLCFIDIVGLVPNSLFVPTNTYLQNKRAYLTC